MRQTILMGILGFLFGVSSCLSAPAPKPRAAKADPQLEELRRDLQRFPPREVSRFWLDFSARHLCWVEERQLLFPAEAWAWREYAGQVRYWRDVWSALEVAQIECYSVQFRREQLDRVREATGEPAWQAGFIWVPVALHLFPESD